MSDIYVLIHFKSSVNIITSAFKSGVIAVFFFLYYPSDTCFVSHSGVTNAHICAFLCPLVKNSFPLLFHQVECSEAVVVAPSGCTPLYVSWCLLSLLCLQVNNIPSAFMKKKKKKKLLESETVCSSTNYHRQPPAWLRVHTRLPSSPLGFYIQFVRWEVFVKDAFNGVKGV